MEWRTLLVPHDFSPCADRALALAAELAPRHGARIVLAHVTHLPPGLTAAGLLTDPVSGKTVRVDEHARSQALAQLEPRAEAVRGRGLTVATRAVVGEIAEQVLALADAEHADVIVMGTHGRTGLAHLLLGSMTEKVLRHARVPVLTVREAAPRRTTGDIVAIDQATD